ncbi:DUF429 domain-containing protein [Natronobeatus ordinarius]|uniref:DUF429 domain-containing protein n=1 Tax=Natronobeatus ordinarius TaxID=2963433 RepID=UPI0020CBEB3E|nr:DUF429 domain-containing protein [Natronobeatus ordinarius]
MTTTLGLDWGGRGWIAVVATGGPDSLEFDAAFFPSMLTVWRAWRDDAETILVDIPIGLPAGTDDLEDEGPIVRECDAAARELLGPDRRSSVFDVPCREAARQPTFGAANARNRERAGRGLTIQAWAITPRILEVEALLREFDDAREVVREAHPEVCFAALGDGPIAASKTTDEGRQARLEALATLGDHYDWAVGLDERYEALEAEHVTDLEPHERRIHGSDRDDLLDAFALAVTAFAGDLRRLPSESAAPEVPRDRHGLPMEIVYHEPTTRSS